MTQPPPPAGDPAVPARPARRPAGAALAAASGVVAAPLLLFAAALAGLGGAGLIAFCVLAAAVLAGLAPAARSAVTGTLAAVFGATALLTAGGIALGARADTSGRAGYPFPVVVGLPLARAEAEFRQHGPVRFAVTKADYGQRGIVLRATGYDADGTYDPGATISLLIGSQVPVKHAR